LIYRKRSFERLTFRIVSIKRPVRAGEIDPQFRGIRAPAARLREMLNGGLRVATGKRLQAEQVPSERLCRIERDYGLQVPARLGHSAGLTRMHRRAQTVLDRTAAHHCRIVPRQGARSSLLWSLINR
jgi:hypothetical protein